MNKTSKGLNRYEIHLTDKLMSEIEAIAESNGAKVHHISKKPIIRDTVISLLELGIKAVYEGVDLPKKPNDTNTDSDNRIDLTVLDSRIEDKLKPLYNLISELSDKLNRISDTDNNSYSDINTDTVTEYEKVGVENVEHNLVTNLLSSIQRNNTEESTLSECPKLPLIESEGENIPLAENKPELEENSENVELLVGLLDEEKENEDKPELDIAELLDKHNVSVGVVSDSAVLCSFFTELYQMLDREMTIDSNNISRIARKKEKSYFVPAVVWEYLAVAKVNNKWQFTRIK